jgi:hypothetical protein
MTQAYLGVESFKKSIRILNGEAYSTQTKESVYYPANISDAEKFLKAVNKLERRENRPLSIRELRRLAEIFYKHGDGK